MLTQTEDTSISWPKNICLCPCSRTSHNLAVLSTEPVIYVFISGDSERPAISPACPLKSIVFTPFSKSQ